MIITSVLARMALFLAGVGTLFCSDMNLKNGTSASVIAICLLKACIIAMACTLMLTAALGRLPW